ncbi:nucleotide pyrophosphohydrolase [Ramlibacter sp. G-1-2-2]|uniref:Nucleotide pyrophosphohydrolase n=1 Tax=Ramlibacter agri TaxID=2728837 RepID=A0A848HIM8_9BURK|nr:nucleotide pyrophosphohydrolase [Ramlibacter agri]NML48363.1 nucleotide pyrophosphohydrolase [Ramlibacter agri]
MTNAFTELAERLQEFARARDWEQFHAPKNLASALSVEAGELLEHFMWLTEEQSRSLAADKREEVAMEMADVLLYLVQLATNLGIDLQHAARKKIEINELRFPVEGNGRKHDES